MIKSKFAYLLRAVALNWFILTIIWWLDTWNLHKLSWIEGWAAISVVNLHGARPLQRATKGTKESHKKLYRQVMSSWRQVNHDTWKGGCDTIRFEKKNITHTEFIFLLWRTPPECVNHARPVRNKSKYNGKWTNQWRSAAHVLDALSHRFTWTCRRKYDRVTAAPHFIMKAPPLAAVNQMKANAICRAKEGGHTIDSSAFLKEKWIQPSDAHWMNKSGHTSASIFVSLGLFLVGATCLLRVCFR